MFFDDVFPDSKCNGKLSQYVTLNMKKHHNLPTMKILREQICFH